jgi:hypothetical protein
MNANASVYFYLDMMLRSIFFAFWEASYRINASIYCNIEIHSTAQGDLPYKIMVNKIAVI